jgi:hypothetical protein
MIATELELQKASLAREILTTTNEDLIKNIWLVIKDFNQVISKKKRAEKRDIGFLKGKAEVIFHDDWSMTAEELGKKKKNIY